MIANLKTLLGWYRQHPDTELRRRITDEWLSTLTIPPEIKVLLDEEVSETRRKYWQIVEMIEKEGLKKSENSQPEYVCSRCGQPTDRIVTHVNKGPDGYEGLCQACSDKDFDGLILK